MPFDEDTVVNFLKTSSSSSDELLSFICSCADSNEEDFKEPGKLLSIFRRLVDLIDLHNLSQSAVDKFIGGDSLFSRNLDCRKYFNEVRKHVVRENHVLFYGPVKGVEKAAVLTSSPYFNQDQTIEIRLPYIIGCSIASLNNKVYFIGGKLCDTDDELSTVTVVDPDTGVISQSPSLKVARQLAAVATSSTEIFACGGFGENGFLDSCERFEVGSASWLPLSSLNQSRTGASAIVLGNNKHDFPNGKHLLITGGLIGASSITNVEMLRLGVDDSEWIELAHMLHGRLLHGIALFGGRVFVAGGVDGENDESLSSVEMLTLPHSVGELGQWTQLAPISQPACLVNLAVYQNRLLCFAKLENQKSQIEEFIDNTPRGSNDPMDVERLKLFTWCLIGQGPDVLEELEGGVVV